MPNQYTKLTPQNVRTKLFRRDNPVRSVAQMAREFDAPRTSMRRYLQNHLAPWEWNLLTTQTRKFISV